MIIKPKQKAAVLSENDFIAKAPDMKIKGVKKGHKQQISLTISPALLEKIDEMASELGQSRAAIINFAIYRAIEYGLNVDSLKMIALSRRNS